MELPSRAGLSKQCSVTVDSLVTLIICFMIGYFPGGQKLAVILGIARLQHTNVHVLRALRPGINYILQDPDTTGLQYFKRKCGSHPFLSGKNVILFPDLRQMSRFPTTLN